MTATPSTTLAPGAVVNGFEVRAVTPLPDLGLLAIELEHRKSGARMIHLAANDPDNLFSINFPTPNRDDRGIPHILEHTVLSGSRRYPVRDPFFELVKMSMATFLNAMTGRDCTYYPVSSNVEKDLFNLADVYFDAVFHPLLAENSFKREGHHLCPADPADPTGPLSVNGIVYNEMKSYFSKPEEKLARDIYKGLLPDTVYGCESGGDPESIPDLPYEDFLAFHRTWYHPSNARIVTYGDIPAERFLEFLDPRLSEFDRTDVRPEFPAQPRWDAPRRLEAAYAAEEGEDLARQTFHVLAWLLPDGLDPRQNTRLSLLHTLLCGDDAAPLKRAIVDSGLGEDVLAYPPSQLGRDTLFAIGLRGSDPDKFEAFRALVFKTLHSAADKGFPSDLVESAFRREIYDAREIEPMRGLGLADDVLSTWIHGADPLLFLHDAEDAEACRAEWRTHRTVFQDLIRSLLLDNPHRLDYTLAPSPAYQAAADERFRARMAEVRARYTDDDARAFAAEDARLQEEAGRPNSPEALATLPQLGRNDLPAAPAVLPTAADVLPCGVPFLRTDLFANGVNYLAVHADLTGLPADLWPYVSLYADAFNSMGAAGEDFAAIARRASAATGGISCAVQFTRSPYVEGLATRGLVFHLKAIDETVGAAMDLLSDKLAAVDPRDRERLRDVVTQDATRGRAALSNGGNRPAVARLLAAWNEEGWLAELQGGTAAYRFVRDLQKDFDKRARGAIDAVLRIAAFLRNRARFTVSFVGGDAAADQVRRSLDSLLSLWPSEVPSPAPTGWHRPDATLRLGLAHPMQVAHCAQLVPALPSTHPDAPVFQLGASMLAVDWAIAELRFKGNAYGAKCAYRDGALLLTTYADPHVKRTLDVFRTLPDFVRNAPWTDVEVTRGILNRAKDFIRPVAPGDAAARALTDRLLGATPERIAARYDTMRSATPERLKDVLLPALDGAFEHAPVAIVSSREKLEKANAELGPDAALAIEPLVD